MSKQNNTRLILDIKQTILIKNSETAKDIEVYGNLFNSLQKHDNLSELELGLSNCFDKKAVAVLTNEQIKKALMLSVMDEWFAVDYYEAPGQKIPCQLCHTPNKYIYYIRNRINGNELHIGSECRKQFPGIGNIKLVRKEYKDKEIARYESIRRTEFGEAELNEPDYVPNAVKEFNDFYVLLPYVLYSDIKQILYDLNFIKTDYIKNGGEIEEISAKYKELKNEHTRLWNRAIDFYKENRNNQMICKKYMSEWLKERHPDIWEQVSRNDGLFTVETLKFAYNNQYVLDHLSDFKKHLKDPSIKIININGNIIRFIIENEKYRYPVYFSISTKFFMNQIGRFCLTDSKFIYNRFTLTEIDIDNTEDNINALYNRLKPPMDKIGLAIDIDKYSQQMYYKRLPKITKRSKWSEKLIEVDVGYKKVDTKQFIYICRPLIFVEDEYIERFFEQILQRLDASLNWISQKQRDEEATRAKELSFQKQREFTNYV